MIDFEPLERILKIDFSQMRAVECPEGRRAEPEVIEFFINEFNSFFAQFKERPEQEIVQKYVVYMEQITFKINASEYTYYLGKYSKLYPEYAEAMAVSNKLNGFKDIPKRMQYWADLRNGGDTHLHRRAVKGLDFWAGVSERTGYAARIGFHAPASTAAGEGSSSDAESEPMQLS